MSKMSCARSANRGSKEVTQKSLNRKTGVK